MQNAAPGTSLGEFSSMAEDGEQGLLSYSGLAQTESAVCPEPSSSSPLVEFEACGQEQDESGEGNTSSKGKDRRKSQEQLLRNRSAQRRFRERQKSRIIELEEWTAALNQQIKQLREDKDGLQLRNNALVRLAEQKTWQLERAKTSGYTVDEDAQLFTDPLELTIKKGQPITLLPEQVQSLNREDLVRIWKEYIQHLGECLAKEDLDSARTQNELAQLTNELVMLLLRVAICSPQVLKSFAACNMENSGVMEDDLEGLYRSLVADMQLSPSQRQEMVQLRQLFLAKEHSISRQRSETVLMLVELQNSSASLSTERRSSQAYLQAHEAVVAIQQSLQEEHTLKLDFISHVFKHLMTPQQLAQCLVRSYPWFPDTLALTSWVASEAGDAQAMLFFGGLNARHISSASGVSGFNLSRGGSVRSMSVGGGLQSAVLHPSGHAGLFSGMPMAHPPLQTFSGHSGMYQAHSPVNSPMMHQPISPHSPHQYASPSPANSPRFHAESIGRDMMHAVPAPQSASNPFADAHHASAWGFGNLNH